MRPTGALVVGLAVGLWAGPVRAAGEGNGPPLTFEQRSKVMDALSRFVDSLAETDPKAIDAQLAAFVAKTPDLEAAGYEGRGNFWARFRDGRALVLKRSKPEPKAPAPDVPADWADEIRMAREVAGGRGGFKAMTQAYDRALGIAEKAGPETALVAATLNLYAGAVRYHSRSTADYKRTVPMYRRSLAIEKKLLGEHHPKVVNTLIDLSRMLAQSSPKEAIATLQEAGRLSEALDPPSPELQHEVLRELQSMHERFRMPAKAREYAAQEAALRPPPGFDGRVQPPPDAVSALESALSEPTEGHKH